MNKDNPQTLVVSPEDAGKRLDIYLTASITELTRSAVKNLISNGLVSIDGAVETKAGAKVKSDNLVSIEIIETVETPLAPEPIDLDILFEDDHIIVVNKSRDIAVHPGAGNRTGTLAAGLLSHTEKLSTLGGADRPGIVHRLDKMTTGVMVIAKDDETHEDLKKQFSEHTVSKCYHALVWGKIDDDTGEIDLPIGRSTNDRKKISINTQSPKEALTRFSVLKRLNFITLLELRPETGRTHQLRVHLTSIGHPVVGDHDYGRRNPPPALAKNIADMIKGVKGQCLHALSLSFDHPKNGKRVEFTAPYPADMAAIEEALEKECS